MNRKYECLTIFIYGINLVTGLPVQVNSKKFKDNLVGFLSNFYMTEYKTIDKMLDIHYSKGKSFSFKIDYTILLKYCNLYKTNPQKFCQLYDDIGWEDTEEITGLAELFCWYVNEINEMNNVKIKHQGDD